MQGSGSHETGEDGIRVGDGECVCVEKVEEKVEKVDEKVEEEVCKGGMCKGGGGLKEKKKEQV